ncbi:MAG: leader peptidase (prepilin peptidase) / N-methyltransferase [Parcubacteria group bacterium Gr01-1014_48]|nr:MAG: leader peptidase (prepilin peptidase) / N-methyltransferase [Parcubacteria group bacterium Greene0416_14]TSC73662.1 MAG: leader peptidase (prepilin peptidase) / N-methyltransferase [Parcubacteria group bacterium Gr01-1014_48]TSD01102.1 MAG: leader peptidase (prepilin peptidase) / N-methyltransferase [Parcubacteria group bacterium Greene1014_15]TSD06890.1 MAG: leader peptidase (prepilin peptidase) / N-methyltransferase [Parcubacteria group bacterium Greene0714_4]
MLVNLYALYVVIFIFGTIIGSFLNVVVLRFNTGASLSGRSRCFTCAKQLRWLDMLPVFSYLILRGRCRSCKSSFSFQYPLVEILAGLLFLGTFIQIGDMQTDASLSPFLSLFSWGRIFFFWIFWSLLLVIAVYDIRHKIIPDFFVYCLGTLGGLGIFLEAYLGGLSSVAIMYAFSIGLFLALPFFLIWYFSHGRAMGFGDVKLALVLGWFVTLPQAIALFVLSFWIGGIVGIVFLCVSLLRKNSLSSGKSRVTMKSEMPFAPFLIFGMIIVFFCSVDIFTVIGWFEQLWL